ncbi:sulfurtransferase TusA family protein [Sporolituus thermophilus]|uniref:TusA-related sulfurtransferase n=1 Tax=Sporolituus thermophilus DSM 23256 TaxID=1123285 RepID=A0A1G7PKA3_9FIRM|nr:sulfurtransferase TusA family protein [Sporolituus thermophilus]SDF86564.1 TusA-related sulfurtransferase [Sporolituus thermophilus DSM 23256]
MHKVLDLRGLSCPIPLIKTRDALQDSQAVTVLVDDMPPKENILRFAKSQGYKVDCQEREGEYTIRICRE